MRWVECDCGDDGGGGGCKEKSGGKQQFQDRGREMKEVDYKNRTLGIHHGEQQCNAE